MDLQAIHRKSLETSTALCGFSVPHCVKPVEVIDVLNEARIPFVLVGVHAFGGWMREPRATESVDILVATRGYQRSIVALLESIPGLIPHEDEMECRFDKRRSSWPVIRVSKATGRLDKAALKHTYTVHLGERSYRIPSLEVAVVLRFASMVTLGDGDPNKYQHAHDFLLMIAENPGTDLAKLCRFGDMAYPGGGRDMLETVRRVRAGGKLNLHDISSFSREPLGVSRNVNPRASEARG